MAVVFATKTGNWSDPTVWNTGALPTSADDVYSNTFTVTINQNINVKSISNDATTGVTAGGGFAVSATPITITANLNQQLASSVTLLTVTQGASGRLDIIGNVTANRGTAVSLTTFNILNITGNVTGGTSTTASVYGVYVAASYGIITVNGNVYGGTGTGTPSYGILVSGSIANTTINVNGSVFGGNGASAQGINLANASTGTTINVIGSIVAGNSTTAHAISINQNNTGTIINVTGDVYATSTSQGYCVVTSTTGATGSLTIVGTITGGNGMAVNISQSGAAGFPVYHTGTAISGTYAPAISAYAPYCYTTGPLLCNAETGANVIYAGFFPVYGRIMFYPTAYGSFYFRVYSSVTQGSPAFREAKDLYFTDAFASGYPSATNVRSAITYGPANIYTGTCAVPPASSVLTGVPVGATTGTATIGASDIRAALGLSSANLDTQLGAIPTANQNASAVRVGLTTELSRILNTATTQQVSDIVQGAISGLSN